MVIRAITDYYDVMFWVLFILIGVLVISSATLAIPLLDLALGLVLVTLGFHKIYEEIRHDGQEMDKRNVMRRLDDINSWLGKSHMHGRKANEKHTYRLNKLDEKRAALDKKIEKNYRDLARKIIELENEVNRMKRAQKKAYKAK